jgi:hypothetical protein
LISANTRRINLFNFFTTLDWGVAANVPNIRRRLNPLGGKVLRRRINETAMLAGC